MKIDISKLPHRDELTILYELFGRLGHDVRLVGGAVRDLLLNKIPKDIDLVTTMLPDQMMTITKNGITVIPTGHSHGTITFVINSIPFEITTLRIDTNCDGRHADVEFTTEWEADAARRDLTYNAMMVDFNGQLYDWYGGREDLLNHRTKFVGDAEQRIREDYLRILRYYRFLGRMDEWRPKDDYADHVDEIIRLTSDGLNDISGERIWSEMSRILTGNHVDMIWTEMMKNVSCLGLKERKSNIISKSVPVMMASFIDTFDYIEEFRRKWKIDNTTMTDITDIVRFRNIQLNEKSLKEIIIRHGRNTANLLVMYHSRFDLQWIIDTWDVSFPINGNDIMSVGYRQGKEVGIILGRLKDAWIDSNYTLTANEMLSMITKSSD